MNKKISFAERLALTLNAVASLRAILARIIDVFICQLRKKLANASGGKNYVETV